MCSAKNDGLVRYPTVRASASGYKTVHVQCADNANNATSSMTVWCGLLGFGEGFLVTHFLYVSAILDIVLLLYSQGRYAKVCRR